MITLSILNKDRESMFEVQFENEYLRDQWLKKHRLPRDWRRHKNYNRYLEVVSEFKED